MCGVWGSCDFTLRLQMFEAALAGEISYGQNMFALIFQTLFRIVVAFWVGEKGFESKTKQRTTST